MARTLPVGGATNDVDALLGATLQGATRIARQYWKLCEEEKERVAERKRRNLAMVIQPCREWETNGCRRGDKCKFIHAARWEQEDDDNDAAAHQD